MDNITTHDGVDYVQLPNGQVVKQVEGGGCEECIFHNIEMIWSCSFDTKNDLPRGVICYRGIGHHYEPASNARSTQYGSPNVTGPLKSRNRTGHFGVITVSASGGPFDGQQLVIGPDGQTLLGQVPAHGCAGCWFSGPYNHSGDCKIAGSPLRDGASPQACDRGSKHIFVPVTGYEEVYPENFRYMGN
ncbi:MAG: hypothetical protein LBU16_09095 [Treponema sp.]|jgi:hypothetical protein|nr:hypothetical protein [Treponema sp.]